MSNTTQNVLLGGNFGHNPRDIVTRYPFTSEVNGGKIVAEVLKQHGVEFIFTLTGGHISPILVACKDAGVRVIDVRHEVNAVFAADAVARITGVPGVAAVTAGPGVSNTITALKNAQMAQSPLVLFGGASSDLMKGRGSLQDIDQLAMVGPHVKWCAHVGSVGQIAPLLELAFQKAREGVPGPVFLEFPLDILYPESTVRTDMESRLPPPTSYFNQIARWWIKHHVESLFSDAKEITIASPKPYFVQQPSELDIKRAVAILQDSKRPLLILGSQMTLGQDTINDTINAIESMNIPTYLTSAARGLLGPNNPIQFRHRRKEALKSADVVVALGVALDFRFGYGFDIPSKTKIIACNRSKEDLYLNKTPTLAIHADPTTFAKRLAYVLPNQQHSWKKWTDAMRERDAEREVQINKDAEAPANKYMNPVRACQVIQECVGENAIMIGDGGDFVATLSQIVRPRKALGWMDSGVFGTLGVGAGFAMAAKLVDPEAEVWLFWGDGSCGYSVAEYDTFVRHNIPVISVVGNDAAWQQIKRAQVDILKDDVASVLKYNDYQVANRNNSKDVVKAFDGEGYKAENYEQLKEQLMLAREKAKAGIPVMVNCLLGETNYRAGAISV